ncbi:hypothetical protein CMT75_18630 [Elizabethkingia anophelis]|uniref:hypothetical protein n=1 Tax=Elizabethkingia sp. M8 TaxID=2796140 RepID=UPI001904C04D|nr:hypothetical protein [Elizabethkingia sp. M8]MDV3950534.1 hypothetical protein [Elizabethkingia anophelis]QQM26591.1 hypothetical protein JCR23_17395 [Elizabethkingia sp. M8]
MKKNILVTVLAVLTVVMAIDYQMLNFGTKKAYEIKEKKGAVIKGDFASGMIAYGNDNLTIYKWEIASIKEVSKRK